MAFESLHPDHAAVAQMVERLPEKEQAEGSGTSGGTHAVVAQWQSTSFPNWPPGFDSP